MLESIISIAFVAQTIRISVPYILASLGGTFSERGGVVNIALEGILLNGAFCATVGTYYTGDPWFGVLCGMIGGVLTALVHAVVTVTFKADQIVTGIALNLCAVGATKFVLKLLFGSSSNSERIVGLPTLSFPILSDIPIIGTIISHPIILATLILVIASQYTLFRTVFGLRLRAVGENPEAADTLGIRISRMRYAGVLLSGALAGLGGAWLAMDQHSFTDGMSAGRGFIALAAMIVGKWNPLGATLACLLFGFAESLQIQLQGSGVPTQFIQMIPYLLTIIVLAEFIGRSTPPAADGLPYEKEQS